ncbi:MAG: molybdopterin converting factor subunit 1 [Acidobacteria bacterium]|nr:molybdopterin converting factor subunit 1 [Acidobacteriota bacterium]
MDTITIEVRLFGHCRELAGISDCQLTLPAQTTVKGAVEQISGRFGGLEKLRDRLLVAVNEEYATPETLLRNGDTVALIPPVSGGEEEEDIFEITHDPIDARQLVSRLLRGADGAVVTFDGVVREQTQKKAVRYLEYEAYEPMALKMLRQIGLEVRAQWPIDRVGIIHRLGRLEITESSVVIVVTSAHRRIAFEACHFAIDRLKKIVPIWKHEFFEDGDVWVEGGTVTLSELHPLVPAEERT